MTVTLIIPGSTSVVTYAPTGSMALVLASVKVGRSTLTLTSVRIAASNKKILLKNCTACVEHPMMKTSEFFWGEFEL